MPSEYVDLYKYTYIYMATIPTCIWDMSLMGNLNYPTLDCQSLWVAIQLGFLLLEAKRQATKHEVEIHFIKW